MRSRYYGHTKEYYKEQLSLINNQFSNQVGFGGVAVHYIDTFLQLK